MRLGVVVSVLNGKEYLNEFLFPWIKAREDLDIKIAFLDASFQSSSESGNSTDGTLEALNLAMDNKHIDFLGICEAGHTEAEVRNVGAGILIDIKCDFILTTAVDEIFTLNQIQRIYDYLSRDQTFHLYYLQYKNFINTRKTYIKGFCPKRIWRTDFSGLRFGGFRFDDDGFFLNSSGDIILDENVKSEVISDIEINHYTWLDNETSRKKIEYQNRRGWTCSYKWDNGKVVFNEDYYRNKTKPIIYNES